MSAWQEYKRHFDAPPFKSLGVVYVDQIEPVCLIAGGASDKMVICPPNIQVSYEAIPECYKRKDQNPFLSRTEIDWNSIKRAFFPTKQRVFYIG